MIQDCYSGTVPPTAAAAGQALIDAMQAAQDGTADSCTGLGTPSTVISGPYTLVLDPQYTYQVTQVNNYTDGPDGLPAVINAVTIESATSQQAVIQAVQPSGGGQTFRILAISAPISGTTSEYQHNGPSGTWLTTPTPGGNLTLQDVTLEGGDAVGASSEHGGGGLGAGGAIFNQGGTLSLVDTIFTSNKAIGGETSAPSLSGYGGGGMGPNVTSSLGGGGMQTEGDASGDGGGPNGGIGGGNGGFGGGGSGFAFGVNGGIGNGGFGGGGGVSNGVNGGNGGFGGGGGFGDLSNGGNGGFGGGGGVSNGGNGGNGGFGGGGNGSGMGGALFDYEGVTTVMGGSFSSNNATANYGAGGSGYGGAIFQYGGTLTIGNASVTGNTATYLSMGGAAAGGGLYLYGATSDPTGQGISSDVSGPVTVDLTNANVSTDVASTDSNIGQTGSVTLNMSTASPPPPPLRYLDLTGPATKETPGNILAGSSGTVGQFFFEVLQSAGGVGYGIWSLKEGALPPGVQLEASGALVGTPTQAGTYTLTAQVTDLAGDTATHALTVTIFTAP